MPFRALFATEHEDDLDFAMPWSNLCPGCVYGSVSFLIGLKDLT